MKLRAEKKDGNRKRHHQFILWSLKSKFLKNEVDFDAVIQSFEVIQE